LIFKIIPDSNTLITQLSRPEWGWWSRCPTISKQIEGVAGLESI